MGNARDFSGCTMNRRRPLTTALVIQSPRSTVKSSSSIRHQGDRASYPRVFTEITGSSNTSRAKRCFMDIPLYPCSPSETTAQKIQLKNEITGWNLNLTISTGHTPGFGPIHRILWVARTRTLVVVPEADSKRTLCRERTISIIVIFVSNIVICSLSRISRPLKV